ncbi:MAG: FAD-dependent oxidoreductase [Proteobacteria bacterium]|nr:FAD-dependent oxidoreductase [Pseudomonadota bacterium]
MSSNTGKRVVVFGGGIAGVQLAKALAKETRVTLVDPNDYFEVPMAAPRCLVSPKFAGQSVIPYAASLPTVEFVQGRLIEMSAAGGEVQIGDGSRITLRGDVNVLCTGNAYSNSLMRSVGGSAQARRDFYLQYRDALNAARRILIVGGGPIGVEVAGEISEVHPDKSLTILEGGPRLLAGTSELAAQHAAAVLASRGVSILVGERLQSATTNSKDIFGGRGLATTTSGREIAYDLLIWCTGGRPSTSYMQANFSGALDERGRIRVGEDLRVAGQKRLLALGDITDLDENKMAWHITGQVSVAAHNIQRILGGHDQSSKLAKYKAQTGNPKMAITLGSRQGVLHMPPFGVIRSPLLTRKAKAEHMLVPKYRKLLQVGA